MPSGGGEAKASANWGEKGSDFLKNAFAVGRLARRLSP